MSALDVRGPAWMAAAVCSSTDPALFFPDQGESPRAAKQICAVCPCSVACLSWAVGVGEINGIYGGLTARERRALREAA